MKKQLLFIMTLALMFSSCSIRTIQATTTHKQVMDGFKTKDIIIAKFGLPTSKKTEGEYEEWLFDYGTKTITEGQANTNARATTNGGLSSVAAAVGGRTAAVGASAAAFGSNTNANSASRSRSVTQDFKTYVKFTFKGDQVITWESNGVDYAKYEIVKQKVF
jgi:hypothetical protein